MSEAAAPGLILAGFPTEPGVDVALNKVLLDRVSEGSLPECWRLSIPAPAMVFGPGNLSHPGLDDACRAAASHGFSSVIRATGGQPAVYDTTTIAFAWFAPGERPGDQVGARYERSAGLIVDTLAEIGVDARIGLVEREYCPGRYSVNARGETKLAGIAQRLARNAALIGGVLVVDGVERIAAVLKDVYAILGLTFDPATVGSVAAEAPGATVPDLMARLQERLAPTERLVLPDEVIAQARRLASSHLLYAA